MDYTYDFPLFTSNELEMSFNYLYRNKDNCDEIDISDLAAFTALTYSDDAKLRMVILANSKRVQSVVIEKFLPELSLVLKVSNQEHGFITLNPNSILAAFNPFLNKTANKFIDYSYKELRNMSNIWMYFKGFINQDLEQIIKSKYKDYIINFNGTTYLKISPDENYSFIYDLIDDIFSCI